MKYTRNWKLEPRVQIAIDQIKNDFGDIVEIVDTLRKFGLNENIGTTEETLWLTGGNETYLADNLIDSIISTEAGDTQLISLEGRTIDGDGEFTKVTDEFNLTGDTRKALPNNLARVARLINKNSEDFAGTVTVFINGGATYLTVDSRNQSLKLSTTMPKNQYWIITSSLITMIRDAAQTRRVDISYQIREKSGVFRTLIPDSISTESPRAPISEFDPCLIVPKNADFRVTATSSGTTTQVQGYVTGYIAQVV